jgi:hypothetical protein
MRAMCGGVCLFRRLWVAGFWAAVAAVIVLCVVSARAQDSPTADAPPQPDKNVPAVQQPAQQAVEQTAPVGQPQVQAQSAPAGGVPDVFVNRIPADQMAFLSGMAGARSGDVIRDKQFKKMMKSFVPTGEFHYGRDMGLDDALHMVMDKSLVPAQIHDGRYFTIAGSGGPYLAGRAVVWIDMKEGVGIGAFYFHPTNGEPTPSVAVFSRQVKEKALGMTDMPEAFAEDLNAWAEGSRVPALTTRYFITGSNMRVLLEHDEDYCSGGALNLVPQGEACEQMDADAADLDEVAAYYLDQVHYRMNATAWMIGPDQVAWIGVRDRTCGGVADALGCRIRVTREHTRRITGRPAPRPHPVGRR